jgi:hypothetical protein
VTTSYLGIPLRLRLWARLAQWRVLFEKGNAECRHDGSAPLCLACCYHVFL